MYSLAINSFISTHTRVLAPKRNDRKMLSFDGSSNQFQHLANENQRLKDLIESDNFDYIRKILRQIKTWKDKQSLQEFNLALTDLRKIIQTRIEELIPSEKIKNAEYIKRNKIGESVVTLKENGSQIPIEFTKDFSQHYAFINSIKAGEITLRQSHSSGSYYAHSMESYDNETYKGIGTKMHQLGVETSINELFKGNVKLHADNPGAKIFHYKYGFRKCDDQNNEYSKLIESVISGEKQLSEIDNNQISMYLPEEQIQRIIETQIKISPIIKK